MVSLNQNNIVLHQSLTSFTVTD